MFTLIDDLTESVEINGVTYAVDMSFDNVLRLTELMGDKRLYDETQIITGIALLFDEPLEGTLEEQTDIFNQAYTALFGIDEDEVEYDILGNPMPKRNKDEEAPELPYDLQQDAEYIYASFLQDYNIDLFEQQGKMHWYKFKALLNGLSEATKLIKVIGIRQMELPTGKDSGKHRAEVEKQKAMYALKNRKAVDE